MIGRMVIGFQGTFIKGRQIHEIFLVAHECLYDMKTQRKKMVVLKLDFEKTYDWANWKCLFDVLEKNGIW